jgi:hypothetical protein
LGHALKGLTFSFLRSLAEADVEFEGDPDDEDAEFVAAAAAAPARFEPLPSAEHQAVASMLFSACQVVLETWVKTKETLIKTVAIETLGYLSFVTSPTAFEQQLPELLHLFDPLGKQQNLPQIATLRGLRLLLEVNPKLLGKPRAREIFLKLFNLVQACGFSTDVAKARSVRAAVLRAARPLAERYLDVIAPVLQEKLAGRREERLAALVLLEQMAGTESLADTEIVRDLSAIAKDADTSVAYSLIETVAAFGRAGLLQPPGDSGIDPGPLLKFVVEQAMHTEADLTKAERGELVKLVQRRFQDGTQTLRDVQAKALDVLGKLADHPRCRRVTWPVLLNALIVRESLAHDSGSI